MKRVGRKKILICSLVLPLLTLFPQINLKIIDFFLLRFLYHSFLYYFVSHYYATSLLIGVHLAASASNS